MWWRSHSKICYFMQLAQLKEAEGAIDGEAADEIANLRYHDQLCPYWSTKCSWLPYCHEKNSFTVVEDEGVMRCTLYAERQPEVFIWAKVEPIGRNAGKQLDLPCMYWSLPGTNQRWCWSGSIKITIVLQEQNNPSRSWECRYARRAQRIWSCIFWWDRRSEVRSPPTADSVLRVWEHCARALWSTGSWLSSVDDSELKVESKSLQDVNQNAERLSNLATQSSLLVVCLFFIVHDCMPFHAAQAKASLADAVHLGNSLSFSLYNT